MEFPNPYPDYEPTTTCGIIYKELFKHFHDYMYRIQNCFVYKWESDFFCQSKSGYAIEVEVKTTSSDFFADFKKHEKHKLLRNHKSGMAFSKQDTSSSGWDSEIRWYQPGTFTYIKQIEVHKRIPNRFYYAMPRGLVKIEEIPAYAGVLWLDTHEVKRWGSDVYTEYILRCERTAPLLHKTKNDLNNRLLDKFYWQTVNMRQQIYALQRTVREYEKKDRELQNIYK